MRIIGAAATVTLAGLVCAACGSQGSIRLEKAVQVGPGVRLWLECKGSGPVVVADSQLGMPTAAWNGVRSNVRHVRFCAFDRAGVGRSEVRACRCGSLEQNVRDMHALIRAVHMQVPLVLAGASTGGLDALLYARRYPSDVSGLVLVDSPSERAPAPPGPLPDGKTQLAFRSGLSTLRLSGRLGDLPILILSHGERTFSTAAAERGWTRMQRQLSADSSNTLRVIAISSQHVIQVDQPRLVAAALEDAAASFLKHRRLRCRHVFRANGGRCVA